MQFPDENPPVMLTQNDHVHIPDGSFAHIFVRYDSSDEESSSLATEEEEDFDDGVSTAVPESDSAGDNDDLAFFTVQTVPNMQRHVDEPFRHFWEDWEIHGLPQPVVEIEEPELAFAAGHHDRVDQEVSRLHRQVGLENVQCTAVTFGLGLVSLGRRDVEFAAGDTQDLVAQITNAWRDQLDRANAELVLVGPQPFLQPAPNIVLIIAFQWFNARDDELSSALVCEDSAFDIAHNTQPYPIWLPNPVSGVVVITELGLQACFPMGIRQCTIIVAEQDIGQNGYWELPDGALVQTYVHAYPEIVSSLRHMISDVERFYIQARARKEASQTNANIIIRAHGISPTNAPLGFRDMICTHEDLRTIEWVRQMQELWPFGVESIMRVAYISQMTEDFDQETPIFHFIANHAKSYHGVPILVRQALRNHDRQDKAEELWAIVVKHEASHHDFLCLINREPFWWDPDVMHFLSRNGQQLERLSGTWTAGDVVQVHLIFHSDEAMLQWRVRHVENHKMHKTTFDVVNLLQFSMKTNYVFRRFAQTCDNILADKALHDNQEWKSEELVPSAAKPTAADEVALADAQSITADDVRTIHELRQILQELQDPEWIGLNHDFQAIPHLHEAAQWAMQSTQQTMATSTTFHIYTDGSCKAGTAAWAFIVVCEWKNGPNESSQYTRIGFSGDVLCEDIGPFQCTPADAEATAIIAAAEYLLSRRSKDKLSIFLHFDATGVGYAATGEQNLPRQKDTTACRRMGASQNTLATSAA